eukprot:TRINITY_DN5690_c0_g1_i1.p1 TRINITY_DN5690_c0_g1~~TRINITY_DN5690_c0_g1_i1.p1  ORF type:complete len:611 (+),score=186.11 TRINITY_DN5690_c0_g1_i1:301-2133(+)
MKVVKDAYRLIFRKQPQDIYTPTFTVRLYRAYSTSLNKVINHLLSSEYERFDSLKLLLDILDHIILKWGKQISLQGESRKVLEGYFQQILLWTMNKALYFKRGGSSTSAIGVLEGTVSLYEAMKESTCAETVNVCGRFALVLGLLYLEVQLANNALDILVDAVKCWATEQKMRFRGLNQMSTARFSSRTSYKIRRVLLFISVGMYNIGLAYEQQQQHTEALESYRMCRWYCKMEREVFKEPLKHVQRFLAESSAEEEAKILAGLEMKVEMQSAVHLPKAAHNFDSCDLQHIINSIWAKAVDSRDINERIKANNFKVILNTIKGGKSVDSSNARKDNESYSERNSREFLSGQLTARGPTSISPTNAGPRVSVRKEPKFGRKSLKKEQKMLDPDNFFKMKICSDLQIDGDWLDETDPRKRFRQDMIESIMKRESNSHRSLKILKNFLVTKGKDNIVQEPNEKDPRALQKTAYYEIGHKMHSLQTDLATQQSTDAPKKPQNVVDRGQALSSPRNLAEERKEDTIAREREQNKIMTTMAEKLQRDINFLENNIQSSRVKKIKQSKCNKKKGDDLDEAEIMRYQSLANSAAYRITNVPQKKSVRRGRTIKSKFSK